MIRLEERNEIYNNTSWYGTMRGGFAVLHFLCDLKI